MCNEIACKQRWGKKLRVNKNKSLYLQEQTREFKCMFHKISMASPLQERVQTYQEQHSCAAALSSAPSSPGLDSEQGVLCWAVAVKDTQASPDAPYCSNFTLVHASGTQTPEPGGKLQCCMSVHELPMPEQDNTESSFIGHVNFYFIYQCVLKFTKCFQVFLQGYCGYIHTPTFCPILLS